MNERKPIQTKLANFGNKILNQEDLEELLIKWLVSSNQPLQEVDNTEFKEFITSLNPQFKIPYRASLKRKIQKNMRKKKKI